MKWTTQTGQRIDIKRMEDSHIQNCINMLKRKLEKIPKFCGWDDEDIIICDWDDEDIINRMIANNTQEAIKTFEKEQKRRKKVANNKNP